MARYDKEDLSALLPLPAPDANKYSRGKLTLFAGSSTYPGAAILAGWASKRAGAGYSEVLTTPASVPFVQACQPSLVVRSWKDICKSDLAAMRPDRPCAYVVGPGFDAKKKSATTITYFVLEKAKAPILVDGGALSPMSSPQGRGFLKTRFVENYATVITPHEGEARRLAQVFGLATDNPAHLAHTLSLAYGVVTVLKGPETYISDGDEIYAVSCGSSALAKAGTGDVLSGIIGAFLAQGIDPLDAAVLGATLHAKAGCLAADALTSVSVMAEDVIEYVPAAIKSLMDSSVSTHPIAKAPSATFSNGER